MIKKEKKKEKKDLGFEHKLSPLLMNLLLYIPGD